MKTYFTFICTALVFSAFAQYSPELDVRGTDDNIDGSEFQLATPSETNFLRFFSGRIGDPNPHLFFSNQDTFKIANGGADFSKFTELLAIDAEGKVTIGDLSGDGERSVMVDASGMLQTNEVEGTSFSAGLLEDSTIANPTEHTLINWSELHDDSDSFDPVTGTYTVPQDGVYLFKVNCSWRRDGMDLDEVPMITRFRVNGSTFPFGQTTQRVTIRSNYGEDTQFSITSRLLEGDVVNCSIIAITGGPTILLQGGFGAGATSFSGWKID